MARCEIVPLSSLLAGRGAKVPGDLSKSRLRPGQENAGNIRQKHIPFSKRKIEMSKNGSESKILFFKMSSHEQKIGDFA